MLRQVTAHIAALRQYLSYTLLFPHYIDIIILYVLIQNCRSVTPRMQFNSNTFIFFFLPMVLLVHALLKQNRSRNVWLLIVSLLFFSWGSVESLVFLGIYGAVNYTAARLIAARPGQKWLLALAVIVDVAVLFVFKYLNFSLNIVDRLLGTSFPTVQLFQPMGISFITFTAIAYVVDVYKGIAPAMSSPIDFFLYLSLFIKAGQGPIIRYEKIGPELNDRVCTKADFLAGAQRFVAGFGKKVLIADTLGRTVDMVFANVYNGISPATAWLGILFYTFQIYYDFSGYTDMAIGLGRILGFTLPENFDDPYWSKSVSEFWNRWHITLGKWFKDYIYIPLGGNRKGKLRQIFNLGVVWMTTGIWHGAAVHYILWGIYYGALVILEKQIMDKNWYKRIPDAVKWAATFLATIFGWIIFRAESLGKIIVYLKAMLDTAGFSVYMYDFAYLFDAPGLIAFAAAVLLALPRPKVLQGITERSNGAYLVLNLALVLVFAVSVVFMVNSTYNSFIYFQF